MLKHKNYVLENKVSYSTIIIIITCTNLIIFLTPSVQNVLRENSQPDIAELTVQKPQLCEKQGY